MWVCVRVANTGVSEKRVSKERKECEAERENKGVARWRLPRNVWRGVERECWSAIGKSLTGPASEWSAIFTKNDSTYKLLNQ